MKTRNSAFYREICILRILVKMGYIDKSKPPVQPVVCSTPIRGDYWLDP